MFENYLKCLVTSEERFFYLLAKNQDFWKFCQNVPFLSLARKFKYLKSRHKMAKIAPFYFWREKSDIWKIGKNGKNCTFWFLVRNSNIWKIDKNGEIASFDIWREIQIFEKLAKNGEIQIFEKWQKMAKLHLLIFGTKILNSQNWQIMWKIQIVKWDNFRWFSNTVSICRFFL